MPARDYDFDPGASNANNKIANETAVVDTSADRSVWMQQGPFFASSDLFTLYGRDTAGSGAWRELIPNFDYTFSPQFTKASAASGRTVCSYVVIITDSLSEVRADYHALGQYEDDFLKGWFANNSIDRASLLAWLQVTGDTAGTNPLTRHGELKDLSMMEVLNRGLEMIRDAIGNPFSSTVMSSADMTKLQASISNVASKPYVDEAYKRPTERTPATSGNVVVLYSMSASAVSGVAMVTFKASSNNAIQMKQVMVVNDGTSEYHTEAPEIETAGNLFNITTRRVGSVVQVLGTASVDGTFITSLLIEHQG